MGNAGKDRVKALAQAAANAKSSGETRYLHLWNGVYWIGREAPVNAGSYVALYPDGTMKTFKG